MAGLFSAFGGLALTATTGIGTPVPGAYTLLGVAAIVLGGVSLAGGRGGIAGPIVAVFILALVRTDLTFLGVNPNLSTVIQGAILIGVVMFGSLAHDAAGADMSRQAEHGAPPAAQRPAVARPRCAASSATGRSSR